MSGVCGYTDPNTGEWAWDPAGAPCQLPCNGGCVVSFGDSCGFAGGVFSAINGSALSVQMHVRCRVVGLRTASRWVSPELLLCLAVRCWHSSWRRPSDVGQHRIGLSQLVRHDDDAGLVRLRRHVSRYGKVLSSGGHLNLTSHACRLWHAWGLRWFSTTLHAAHVFSGAWFLVKLALVSSLSLSLGWPLLASACLAQRARPSSQPVQAVIAVQYSLAAETEKERVAVLQKLYLQMRHSEADEDDAIAARVRSLAPYPLSY